MRCSVERARVIQSALSAVHCETLLLRDEATGGSSTWTPSDLFICNSPPSYLPCFLLRAEQVSAGGIAHSCVSRRVRVLRECVCACMANWLSVAPRRANGVGSCFAVGSTPPLKKRSSRRHVYETVSGLFFPHALQLELSSPGRPACTEMHISIRCRISFVGTARSPLDMQNVVLWKAIHQSPPGVFPRERIL